MAGSKQDRPRFWFTTSRRHCIHQIDAGPPDLAHHALAWPICQYSGTEVLSTWYCFVLLLACSLRLRLRCLRLERVQHVAPGEAPPRPADVVIHPHHLRGALEQAIARIGDPMGAAGIHEQLRRDAELLERHVQLDALG